MDQTILKDLTVYVNFNDTQTDENEKYILSSIDDVTMERPRKVHHITTNTMLQNQNPNSDEKNKTILFLKNFLKEDENVYTEVQHADPFQHRLQCMINIHLQNEHENEKDGAVTYAVYNRQMPVLDITLYEEGKKEEEQKKETHKISALESILLKRIRLENDPSAIVKEIRNFFNGSILLREKSGEQKAPLFLAVESNAFSTLNSENDAVLYARVEAFIKQEYNANSCLILRRDGYPLWFPTEDTLLPIPPRKFEPLTEKVAKLRAQLQNENNKEKEVSLSEEILTSMPVIPGALTILDRYAFRYFMQYLVLSGVFDVLVMVDHSSSTIQDLYDEHKKNNKSEDEAAKTVVQQLSTLMRFEAHWLDLYLPTAVSVLSFPHHNKNRDWTALLEHQLLSNVAYFENCKVIAMEEK
ncbi:hypothetical protein ADEAN_000599400 [Angomonas deanei]|uniref:Uncharacterized protein n=1 Tax=Angomonas deanei TaxID=59799 RepID=A0A7G2CGM7_9TRYP|nr:hypothetical protein ADEAN_000599400 [Angomonas deanei]